MWFEKLTGFNEKNAEQVRTSLVIEDQYLISLVNGKKYKYGLLEIPTLKELKASVPSLESFNGSLSVTEVVGNVQQLHRNTNNRNALFQAASQFNLLEMVGPHVTPERGVDIYENDHTQGPACAIACGAGTIYRNYFINMDGQQGQTANKQIDCLDEIAKVLNPDGQRWQMRNGYALANARGLDEISEQILAMSKTEYDALKDQLKIGLQLNTQVTITEEDQEVSQAYCSALPVAYSSVRIDLWEVFAKLILEATYEATFFAALRNYQNTECNKLYLTLVGGGAFGNNMSWILNAIKGSLEKFRNTPIDVRIVSYGSSSPRVRNLVDSWN